ncbi:unnamed protein product [Lymnaea stagnalis]|uniref:N-acetylphosphatidylethanolamine-hydrolyzing phospholipase D n=1 Tax=Lymnaea stagnalis TaxID=6523 RepID=A0AAV2IG72_LYMST
MAEGSSKLKEEDFVKPLFQNGKYQNPWKTWQRPSFGQMFKFLFFSQNEGSIPDQRELDRTLPVVKTDLSRFATSPVSGVRHMWIGHASSLVQFDGVTFLTDPIFSDRCSPTQWVGPKRYRPPPCTIDDLPHIDCVVISHNHFDHLDYGTVQGLVKRFGDRLRWYVPMGLKEWMLQSGCVNVVELSWWEEDVLSPQSGVRFVCTPAQHWCKRGAFDDNKVLWCSWCVIGPTHRFYFAGDTGYCHVFKKIGERYGPFTLATIPIGAYAPRWFLSYQHIDPKEAINIHTDIKSRKSIGVHWGTFPLGSKEFYLEPRQMIKDELKVRGMDPLEFITVQHGEIIITGET